VEKGKFPANSGTEEGPVDAMIYAYFRMLLIRLCERTCTSSPARKRQWGRLDGSVRRAL